MSDLNELQRAVGRIEGKVDMLHEALNAYMAREEDTLASLGRRTRVLERFRAKAAGVILVLSLIASVVAEWLISVFSSHKAP